MESSNFKKRVAQVAIDRAKDYKHVFLEYEYLLCSDAFMNRDYYIISANPDNYRHLIGVNTMISAKDFYIKCINGMLQETDFDFLKNGRSEKEIKGSVRRKIKSIPHLTSMIGANLVVQEDFRKNEIFCSFAATDCYVTVGFAGKDKSRPKTLLCGDFLDQNQSAPVDLILRRKTGDALFSEIVTGDSILLQKYMNKIKDVISDHLISMANLAVLV